MMVLAGALGCVVVIIAALGARGSASPEPKAAPAAAAAAPRKVTSAPAKTAPQAAPAVAAVTLPPNTPKWSSANRAFWVGNDRRAVAFELNAINKVQVWMRTVQPMLVVRCMGKKTEVFVYTNSAAKMEPQDEDHTVRISFDNQPLSTDRWPDSADHDGLFSPDPVAFTQRLMAARLLRFGFTPHNAEPVLAQFDVTGLGDLIMPVAKQCGWSK
jgi:hypothetical protein